MIFFQDHGGIRRYSLVEIANLKNLHRLSSVFELSRELKERDSLPET